MKVGIDVTSLIYGRGVSRYTANLSRALLKFTPTEVSFYGSSLRQKTQLETQIKKVIKSAGYTKQTPQIVLQSYPPSVQDLLWNKLKVNPIKKVLPKIDIFHSWDWLQPPDTTLPIVSTVHDLAILRYPETAHPQVVKMHQKAWHRLKAAKAHIIAISRATKKDLIELLDYPSYLIHVVYEALPDDIRETSEALGEEQYAALKQKLNLEKPYILFVGTREPRKNLKRLIKAWDTLSDDVQLLIAGESGWDDTTGIAKQLKNPNLRFLGKVSDQELVVLYSEAQVLAYPCLYEGFGLPILEAFYYGTPVLTSNVSAMIEVAGNAAELVNPESVEDIRSGLCKLLEESLPDQQKRLQRMLIRLQMFSWQRVATETLQVYQQALQDFQKP